jgi:hypothetical protein
VGPLFRPELGLNKGPNKLGPTYGEMSFGEKSLWGKIVWEKSFGESAWYEFEDSNESFSNITSLPLIFGR